MRSLWLAAAAFIVTNGVAFAQTTPPPGMSNPGSMSTQGTMSQPGSMSNPGAMSNQGTMSNQGPMMSPMQPSAGHDQANQYLRQARAAIRQHSSAQADTMLSNAETIILTRAVPQTTGPTPDNSPRVTAIENARTAVKQGNWSAAAQYTDMAIHSHGMMNGSTSGGMNNGGMGQDQMAPPSGPMTQPSRTVQ
jgi:hypothetical protein